MDHNCRIGFENCKVPIEFRRGIYSANCGAEKSLKAFLVYKEFDFEKTHDLGSLVHACASFDVEFLGLWDTASELTPYAIRSRYPDDNFPVPDRSIAIIALANAEEIYEFVVGKIW